MANFIDGISSFVGNAVDGYMSSSFENYKSVKADIRYRHGSPSGFGINDIHISPEQGSEGFNVPKMMLIEKQPRYPIYYGDAMEVMTSKAGEVAGLVWKAFSGGDFAKEFVKSLGSSASTMAGQAAGNVVVDAMSRDEKRLSEYYSYGGGYLNSIKNLFTTLTTDKVISYEVPFLSDYFMEADGSSGWEHNGINMNVGKTMASFLSGINVGYPVTPNWKYGDSTNPSCTNAFTLINDTTENLSKNVKFLVHLIPGMMHVLLDLSGSNGESGGVADTLKSVAGSYVSMFKSPNVYEVIVPSRFRWLWCTMSAEVSCVGKVYNDRVKLGEGLGARVNAFSGSEALIGFPEAFKVEMKINSMLPQSFNEYYYFLTRVPTSGNSTFNSTLTQTKSAGEKVVSNGIDAVTSLGNALINGHNEKVGRL